MWHYWITQSATSQHCGVVHSTPLGLPGRCGICMHQHSTNATRRRRKLRIRRWHHSTHWHMAQWDASMWVDFLWWVALMTERNVTIRSEFWTTNVRRFSLGFQDIRKRVLHYGGWSIYIYILQSAHYDDFVGLWYHRAYEGLIIPVSSNTIRRHLRL